MPLGRGVAFAPPLTSGGKNGEPDQGSAGQPAGRAARRRLIAAAAEPVRPRNAAGRIRFGTRIATGWVPARAAGWRLAASVAGWFPRRLEERLEPLDTQGERRLVRRCSPL